jgi:hypothetical protein
MYTAVFNMLDSARLARSPVVVLNERRACGRDGRWLQKGDDLSD